MNEQTIYDQIQLLEVYASNSTAVNGALRSGLRKIYCHFTALEQQVKEKSQENKSYVECIRRLQMNMWDVIEQLRQSKLQVSRLQTELQSERAAFSGSRQRRSRRQHRNSKRRK